MRIIDEYQLTVPTSGTPVSLTNDTRALEAVICNNNSDDTRIVVGQQATVDALSSPPIGRVLEAGDSTIVPVQINANTVWIDANKNGAKATVQIIAH